MAFGWYDHIQDTLKDLYDDGISVGGVDIDLTPEDELPDWGDGHHPGSTWQHEDKPPEFPWYLFVGGGVALFLLLRR